MLYLMILTISKCWSQKIQDGHRRPLSLKGVIIEQYYFQCCWGNWYDLFCLVQVHIMNYESYVKVMDKYNNKITYWWEPHSIYVGFVGVWGALLYMDIYSICHANYVTLLLGADFSVTSYMYMKPLLEPLPHMSASGGWQAMWYLVSMRATCFLD